VDTRSDPEKFVTKFADFWDDPSPQRLPELLHPDVVLVQPLAAPMIGIQAAQAEFQRIWCCLPDLRARVDRWCGHRDLVFIEFRLHARIGGKVSEWPNVNRLVLRDGKAIELVTYFNPLAILPTLLRHPSIGGDGGAPTRRRLLAAVASSSARGSWSRDYERFSDFQYRTEFCDVSSKPAAAYSECAASRSACARDLDQLAVPVAGHLLSGAEQSASDALAAPVGCHPASRMDPSSVKARLLHSTAA
jgi:SnoaL-like domain